MSRLVSLIDAALLDARRRRDVVIVSALRTASAAMANAEAVPAHGADTAGIGRVGATDVPRRELTEVERAEILRAEVADLRAAAEIYRDRDADRAEAALRGADAVEALLGEAHDV
ncbi:hypothetical protein GCM10027425_19770 [Alteromonas gracilis]